MRDGAFEGCNAASLRDKQTSQQKCDEIAEEHANRQRQRLGDVFAEVSSSVNMAMAAIVRTIALTVLLTPSNYHNIKCSDVFDVCMYLVTLLHSPHTCWRSGENDVVRLQNGKCWRHSSEMPRSAKLLRVASAVPPRSMARVAASITVTSKPKCLCIFGRIAHAIVKGEADTGDFREAALLQIAAKTCWCFVVILKKGGIAIDGFAEALADDQFGILDIQASCETRHLQNP